MNTFDVFMLAVQGEAVARRASYSWSLASWRLGDVVRPPISVAVAVALAGDQGRAVTDECISRLTTGDDGRPAYLITADLAIEFVNWASGEIEKPAWIWVQS